MSADGEKNWFFNIHKKINYSEKKKKQRPSDANMTNENVNVWTEIVDQHFCSTVNKTPNDIHFYVYTPRGENIRKEGIV